MLLKVKADNIQHIYYLDLNREKRNTAGAKAPDDIAELCKNAGYKRIVMPDFPNKKSVFYQKLWLSTVCIFKWYKIAHQLPSNSIVFYQHPLYGVRITQKMIPKIQKKKKCKFIALIHDLESLRGGIQGVINANKKTNEIADNLLLKNFDAVICHNEHMRQYLISQGYIAEKLINLEIFDYLGGSERTQTPKSSIPSIAIAGNLAFGKCGYIYDIIDNCIAQNMNLIINLYGNNFDKSKTSMNIIYKGSYDPEELPSYLEGDFGLVWDGISAQTCTGNTGNYLKYNNPHKTSLYLSSGMPVIVWKHAAIADFILEHNLGIAVDSLYQLDEVISKISVSEYDEMCKNVKKIAHNLQQGHYFTNAMSKALEVVSN